MISSYLYPKPAAEVEQDDIRDALEEILVRAEEDLSTITAVMSMLNAKAKRLNNQSNLAASTSSKKIAQCTELPKEYAF